ncbi:MAG TPA: hypothetical protein VGO49_05405 [Bradyrhizobium sp.]|nr:hypothetical protein [Bradyrhizobium sp.]
MDIVKRHERAARTRLDAGWSIRSPVVDAPLSALSSKRVLCYASDMTAKKLKDVLERVEAWPEAAQAELAELALEIDAGLGAGEYHATPEELAGIQRGLKAAREGRFATDEQIEELFKKHRPA